MFCPEYSQPLRPHVIDDETRNMPPKRRLSSGSKSHPSKLAKENNLSAAEEQEIQEAFALFATTDAPTASTSRRARTQKTASSIPITDVRRVLTALSLTPSPSELREYISILDPDDEGVAEYEPFLAICALKMRSRVRSDDDHQREVDEAWELFVKEDEEDRITLDGLRSIAKILDEKVADELLKDMLLEANGGAGVEKGVDKNEFEEVMRRAGVWR